MRIPLDYYRILGLPLAASEEQLRQAYSDRIVQLPRREYSQAAITSRKQLIEEAYVVLSDPKERRAYDQLYLAHSYQSDTATSAAVAVESPAQVNRGDTQTPSIDIAQDELVGALLILQELGEYELVLKLGRPYLVNKKVKSDDSSANEELDEFALDRPDIILTVALACLELGREQWQQGHYENAAVSLETGEELLSREGQFLNVQAEIKADLYKLRPYRILELLALPEEKTALRYQGLELLQNILDDRGGIDGTGDDQSGLNIEDFLRFIQQLRNHLTAAEQQKLFEAESERPSSVATYLSIYTLIARGFAERQPALIRQAKLMLMRLGKRQDVHLEQAICALLLGQTEEASRALELSQEYEALAFIRENSHDSPDLLPGLCLYGERWLQNEVFPHFRDLSKRRASLKDYFADQQVQAYLEALPTDAQTTNEWAVVNRQSFSPLDLQKNNPHQPSNSTAISHQQSRNSRTPDPSVLDTQNHNLARQEYNTRPEYYTRPEYSDFGAPSHNPGVIANGKADAYVPPPPTAERIARGNNYHLNGSASANVPVKSPQPQKRRKRKPTPTGPTGSPGHSMDNHHGYVRRRRRGLANAPQARMRLIWLVFGALGSLLVFWLVVTTTVGLFKNMFASSLQREQLLVQLNQPPVSIPDPNSNNQQTAEQPLTDAIAEQAIRNWLSNKAAALGPNHDTSGLEQILVGSALSQWRQVAQEDAAANRYRKYVHNVKVESTQTSPNNPNQAHVEATVKEVAEFYENGLLNHHKFYNESVRVRYNMIRTNGQWRIQEMSVLNKLSMNF